MGNPLVGAVFHWLGRLACRYLGLPLAALALTTAAAAAAPDETARRDAADLADFDRRAAWSRALGANQMVVTDGLPLARWELDRDDPYPEWFVNHASLLKIYPSGAIAPFVDAGYAAHVRRVVADRCRVLARMGLKAVWSANEPSVLPEPFFAAHPQLRGPRIDQPNRSRKTYWAPDTDRTEVMALYRDAVGQLVAACPTLDTFLWVTTDAGSGFGWAPALYPGANGAAAGEGGSLADRVVAFMTGIRAAAAEHGRTVRIGLTQIAPRQWMTPTFGPDTLARIVERLPRGLAVNGREGPDGRPFDTGIVKPPVNAFYPVVGLVVPSFAPVPPANGDRIGYDFGDEAGAASAERMFRATAGQPMATATTRLAALRRFAVAEVGEGHADDLIEAWRALDDTRRYLDVLDFGIMLRFGHVLNRWIERPLVPFPLALTAAEKAGWAPFLFQAKGEAQAADLADIQAMRMFEGWGAHLLFQRDVELATARAERALALVRGLAAADPVGPARRTLTAQRIEVLILLMRSADDAVAYQAHLDRLKTLDARPEPDPVLGARADWALADMTTIARREIDLTVRLGDLLAGAGGPILDLAPTPAEEAVMRLGPDLPATLRRKVITMNAHWRDYDRLFTAPNP